MAQGAIAAPPEPADHSHPHPSEWKYIQIAIYLTIITMFEVAVYYIDWMHDSGALVPTLFVLSIAKFLTVIGYYMHLKVDDPRFRYIFLSGLLLSLGIVAALFVLLTTHQTDYSFGLL